MCGERAGGKKPGQALHAAIQLQTRPDPRGNWNYISCKGKAAGRGWLGLKKAIALCPASHPSEK